jgi:hypothetical protein
MKIETTIKFLVFGLMATSCMITAEADRVRQSTSSSTTSSSTTSAKVEKNSYRSTCYYSFERYQSIIDRQPFGLAPAGFDPSKPVCKARPAAEEGITEAEINAEEQRLMASVRVSILNVTPEGVVMAGFTDSTAQPPANYYLKVGDTSTDAARWTVKNADPAAGTVTLSKDGIVVTLSVGGATKKSPTAKSSLHLKKGRVVRG